MNTVLNFILVLLTASANSESTVCRTIKKIENTLIKPEQFHLPNTKEIQFGRMALKIVFVDVTEKSIELPQKTAVREWPESITTTIHHSRKTKYLRNAL